MHEQRRHAILRDSIHVYNAITSHHPMMIVIIMRAVATAAQVQGCTPVHSASEADEGPPRRCSGVNTECRFHMCTFGGVSRARYALRFRCYRS